jgi:hypothetical protein
MGNPYFYRFYKIKNIRDVGWIFFTDCGADYDGIYSDPRLTHNGRWEDGNNGAKTFKA